MEGRMLYKIVPVTYLCTDQDTVMRNSSSDCNMVIRLSLLGGLMVHRELELPFSCAMHRSSGM